MFLTQEYSGYNRRGEQSCGGLFLIVQQRPVHALDCDGDGKIYCAEDGRYYDRLAGIVRHVRMTQFGHWMMAKVKLAGCTVVLSGTYGSDGLPINLAHSLQRDYPDSYKSLAFHIWDSSVELPIECVRAFWNGGGHNCGGSEMDLFKRWANENIVALRKPISIDKRLLAV